MLFESIDLDQSMQRTASRKAVALANTRAQKQFSTFLGDDPQTKFAYIVNDLQQLVIQACREAGHDDPQSVYDAVLANLNVPMPKIARRPKMCPFHSELTDISLTLGDPRAALETMGAHQFSESSCRGSYGGSCNWKPDMLKQEFWDQRQQEADQRAEQRQQQQIAPTLTPANDIDALDAENFDYEGPDINEALEEAPSAVGAPEPVMAAKQSWNFDKEKGKKIDDPKGVDDGDEPDDDDEGDKDSDRPFDWDKNKKAKKKHPGQEGNVCASCSDGSCSGCSGGSCCCGGCGGDGGGTTASVRQADDHWIQDAVPKQNKGLLHKKLDVPQGDKIPEGKLDGALHSDNDKLREEAQFAENMKGLYKGAIPGAHDPNYFDPYADEGQEDYGMEGADPELMAALQLEYPNATPEQLAQLAMQQNQQMPEMQMDPNAMNEDYGAPMYASIHESIKSVRNGDSIEEHMDWPAQNGKDTATGLSTDSPVNIDRKEWAPKNMPKLDVDDPNGMHNLEIQDITAPTHFTGDAFDKDDGRFDSFHNPSRMDSLPAAGDDETQLGDSGFAGNNMDNPQSVGDTWHGMSDQTNPITHTPSSVLGSFLSGEEVQRAVRQFKG